MAGLSPDTQATLLLTGQFSSSRDARRAPLTLTEYNAVAKSLVELDARPGDLLQGVPEKWSLSEISKADLEYLLGRGLTMADNLNQWENRGVRIIGRSDVEYPKLFTSRLKNHRPPLLYTVGNLELLKGKGFAMVGSRVTTPDVLDWVKNLAAERSNQGEVVVSGGAKGVDLAAITGALDAGGQAIAVLPNDLGKVAIAKSFRQHILNGDLLLISSNEPKASFQVWRAMERNKYIYALAEQTVIVASDLKSGGTWAGAEEQLDYPVCPHIFVRYDASSEALQALHRLGLPHWPEEGQAVVEQIQDEWEAVKTAILSAGKKGLGVKAIVVQTQYPGGQKRMATLLSGWTEEGKLMRKSTGAYALAAQDHQTSLFDPS